MASATHVVHTKADADETFTLASTTSTGAIYKVASRALSVPKTLEFKFELGNPGSLGNDKLSVIFRDSAANSTTGLVKTLQVKMEVSVPRDAAITTAMVEDNICHLANLLADAVAENIADAIVP